MTCANPRANLPRNFARQTRDVFSLAHFCNQQVAALAFYGCETWILSNINEKTISASYMKSLRKFTNIYMSEVQEDIISNKQLLLHLNQ
jgi:hypothetical protein